MAAGIGAAVVLAGALSPPLLSGESRRASLESLQFVLLGVVVPLLVVLWSPWRLAERTRRAAIGLGERRQRHATFGRACIVLAAELVALTMWRVPVAVDTIARHQGLVAAEVLSLVPIGVLLWAEILDAPPLTARLPPSPGRALLAALTMWTIWIVAYLGGFSHAWYPVYVHRGAGAAWDQQIAATTLWFISAAVFVPVVFYVLQRWLSEGERPDAEMRRLVREERRRRFIEGDLGPSRSEHGRRE